MIEVSSQLLSCITEYRSIKKSLYSISRIEDLTPKQIEESKNRIRASIRKRIDFAIHIETMLRVFIRESTGSSNTI